MQMQTSTQRCAAWWQLSSTQPVGLDENCCLIATVCPSKRTEVWLWVVSLTRVSGLSAPVAPFQTYEGREKWSCEVEIFGVWTFLCFGWTLSWAGTEFLGMCGNIWGIMDIFVRWFFFFFFFFFFWADGNVLWKCQFFVNLEVLKSLIHFSENGSFQQSYLAVKEQVVASYWLCVKFENFRDQRKFLLSDKFQNYNSFV